MIRTYFKRDVISQLQFFTLISFPRPSKKTRFLLVLSFPIIFDRLLLLQSVRLFLFKVDWPQLSSQRAKKQQKFAFHIWLGGSHYIQESFLYPRQECVILSKSVSSICKSVHHHVCLKIVCDSGDAKRALTRLSRR